MCWHCQQFFYKFITGREIALPLPPIPHFPLPLYTYSKNNTQYIYTYLPNTTVANPWWSWTIFPMVRTSVSNLTRSSSPSILKVLMTRSPMVLIKKITKTVVNFSIFAFRTKELVVSVTQSINVALKRQIERHLQSQINYLSFPQQMALSLDVLFRSKSLFSSFLFWYRLSLRIR